MRHIFPEILSSLGRPQMTFDCQLSWFRTMGAIDTAGKSDSKALKLKSVWTMEREQLNELIFYYIQNLLT
jgi:hypothetical protein